MKTLICIPCMDQVPALFARSLAMLQKTGDVAIAFEMSSLIYAARDNLAMQAIQMEADRALWIDSDMVFDPDLLVRLSKTMDETKAEIVTGVCYRRRPPYTPTLFKTLDINPETKLAKFTEFDEIPKDPFEIEGCGLAACLVDTSVFLDVQGKYRAMFEPIGHNGEDSAFCWRARQCGNRIIADPGPAIGHCGQTIITGDIWQAYKEAKGGK